MENKRHNNEKRTYVKPEAELLPLLMNENIVVNPIPQNYGLISWNGPGIRVS